MTDAATDHVSFWGQYEIIGSPVCKLSNFTNRLILFTHFKTIVIIFIIEIGSDTQSKVTVDLAPFVCPGER